MADVVAVDAVSVDNFGAEAVSARGAGEPALLQDRRRKAFEAYQAMPFPTTRLEEWRYTDVSLFRMGEARITEPQAPGAVPAEARALLADKALAASVLAVDDAVVEVELDEELREQGVVVMELAKAASEHPELVEKYMGRAVPDDFGKFAAMNGALWTAGVLVYVPRNVQVDKTIRIARWLTEGGVAHLPRTLVVAEQGSHVAVVEEFASPDFEQTTFANAVFEVVTGPAADVQYASLQNWGAGVRHVQSGRTVAARDANCDTLVVNLGASVARVDLAGRLEEPGTRSDMLGLYFARRDQHFDMNTRQDHVSPHATSDLLYKGALYDESNAVFRGIIRVHPRAQGTDAYQTNRNLLLSESAKSTSLPNLEIEADDVRCSHGATVGQLDEEELFYLMSRGIARKEAERLVVLGFLAEVLDRLPLPALVAELRQAIEERIR